MMRLAIFTATTPDWTPDEAAAALADGGWDGVEWRVTDQPASRTPSFWAGNRCTWPLTGLDERVAVMRGLHERYGLGSPNLGTYSSWTELAAVEAGMRAARALGAPSIRVRAHGVDADGYPASFARARTGYRAVAELAAEYGVRALVETHPGDLVAGPSAALRFLDGFDPGHVGVIHNLGNMCREGFERVDWSVQMLAPYLAHVHIKNTAPRRTETGWEWSWVPLWDGLADFAALVRALREVGYQGWLSVADFSTKPPGGTAAWAARNLDWIRGLLDEGRSPA